MVCGKVVLLGPNITYAHLALEEWCFVRCAASHWPRKWTFESSWGRQEATGKQLLLQHCFFPCFTLPGRIHQVAISPVPSNHYLCAAFSHYPHTLLHLSDQAFLLFLLPIDYEQLVMPLSCDTPSRKLCPRIDRQVNVVGECQFYYFLFKFIASSTFIKQFYRQKLWKCFTFNV